jgi:hypothetical protein
LKINRKLNFVIPIYDAENKLYAYVHSTPLSEAAFESNVRIIAQTFSAIYAGGLGAAAGPRVAAMLIREIAQENAGEEPEARKAALDAVNQSLFSEIWRLTNVITLGPTGWTTLPYEDAIHQNLIDDEDAGEVENALAFFIVASAMHKRSEVGFILNLASKLWSAQTSLLNSTEYAASLPKLTGESNSMPKTEPEKLSSVPY